MRSLRLAAISRFAGTRVRRPHKPGDPYTLPARRRGHILSRMNSFAPIVLLTISNIFMTYAWYWHLKNPVLSKAPMAIVILASWGIAFFEYCFQVPGNRIGFRSGYSAGQLKVLQEAITLAVFCVFAAVVLKQKLTWNYFVGF